MSLTACIKKAAKAISPDDAQYLSQARSEFMQEGMSAIEADRAAVQSLLDVTIGELRDLSAQVEQQGGKPLFEELEVALASKKVTDRTPELQEGIQQLDDGEIDQEQYAGMVDNFKPVRAYDSVPEPEADDVATAALSEDKRDRFGAARGIEDGTPVAVRLDIPAYRDNNTWVVSIHEQRPGKSQSSFQAGKSIGYDSVAVINDVTFGMPEKGAMNIAKGKPKGTIATMKGTWQNMDPADAKIMADEALESGDWIQVGMDPERHSYFYDRGDHRVPVLSAEQVVQVGPLVLAKGAKTGNRADFLFSRTGKPAMDPVQLDSVISRIAPGWEAGNADSPVVVVDTYADLPDAVKEIAQAQDAIREDGTSEIDGAFHDGKVYLVREEIGSEEQAETVLLHEATHGGMIAAFKSDSGRYSQDLYRATNDLWTAVGGSSGYQKIAEELGIADRVAPYKAQIEGQPAEYGRFVMLAEMIAYQGEKGSKGLKTKIREFVGAIRAWLRSQGFFKLADMDANDIANLAKKSREVGLSGQTGTNAPVLFSRDYKMDIKRKERRKGDGQLTAAEKKAIKDAAPKGQGNALVEEAAARKAQYPQSDGWAALDVIGVEIDEEKGTAKPKYQPQPYAYNRKPGAKRAPAKIDQEHVDEIANELSSLVETVYERAKSGDRNAETILAHQSWYRGVTERLRQEFGGSADLFADLLGATSPNTPVDTNYKFSVDILRRFVRGEFEAELAAYDRWIKSGKLAKDFPREDKIQQISGKLYGMNSNNAQTALLDMWRDIKPGTAPKARNFALNLIGQSDMATIDVWAARMLRRAANRAYPGQYPRIPPAAEQGVTGNWNARADAVTGEFGFGAAVLDSAVTMLGEKGIKVTAPDLQAIAWFAEKEHWATNNWTTITGEGGSFEESMDANPAERYIAGWAIQNDDVVPAAEDISRAQERVMLAITGDESVIAARAIPTKGLYGGYVEESFDTEWTATEGYDPSAAMSEIAMLAQEYDQWDMFVSRVIKPEEDNPNARPGVEVYFKSKQDFEMIKPQLEAFTEKGADGFTLIVDPRAQDGEYIGVRLQFIPEISARWDMDMRAEMLEEGGLERIIEEKTAILDEVVADLIGREEVAFAQVFDYDTVVVGKENYDAIINREDAGQNTEAGREVRFGQPVRQGLEEAVRRYDSQPREDESGSLPDGGNELQPEVNPTLASRSRRRTFTVPEEKAADVFIRKFQDKFLQVQRVQRAIEKSTGRKLEIDEDPYLMEQFFTGKAEQDLEAIERKYIKPLMDLMAANDITMDELSYYLIARHAPERNATIAERRDDMPDGGSGMTNQQAADWMAAFDREGKLADLQEIATYVDGLVAEQRKIMADLELINEGQQYMMENNWQYYVPLKGFADDAESDGIELFQKRGKGFDIRGKEYKSATGRNSLPEHPLAVLLSDVTEKVIRGRKNEVGQAFLKMVENNPNPEYYEILKPGDLPKGYNGELDANGKAVERTINLNSDPQILAVKRKGEVKYIKIHDKRLAVAMKNMGPQQMEKWVQVINAGTRFLSSINTSLSPEFPVVNALRDIQTAMYNVLAETSLDDGKIKGLDGVAKAMAKDAFPAMKVINDFYNARNADPNYQPEGMAADFAEFLEMGAKTGYFDSKDIEQLKGDLDNMLQMASGTTKGKFLKGKKKVLDKVEQWNTSVENGVRLSAYKHARDAMYKAQLEAGVDADTAYETAKTKAADLSKNLTVNFNRKGEVGQTLNAFYMFANASIQGSMNLLRAVSPMRRDPDGDFKIDPRMNTAQKLAAGMVGVGYAVAAMNRHMGGEDEDGVPYWDKIPSYERERNLIILDSVWGGSGEKYFKFPLPYGFNLFFNMGDVAEGAMSSEYLPRRRSLLGQMAFGTVNSFSPVGAPGGDDLITGTTLTLMPSLAVPVVELVANKSAFTGGPVYKEELPFGAQPVAAHQSFRSTKQGYKDITAFLNDATGGSEYIEGAINWSPDALEHIVEYALGGLYRTGSRFYETVDASSNGRYLSPNSVPYLRTFRSENRFFEDQGLFYDRLDEVGRAVKQRNELKGPDKAEFVRERGWQIRLDKAAKEMRKRYRLQSELRDKIVASDKYTDAEKDKRVREVEERMKQLRDRFNKAYNEAEARSLGDE